MELIGLDENHSWYIQSKERCLHLVTFNRNFQVSCVRYQSFPATAERVLCIVQSSFVEWLIPFSTHHDEVCWWIWQIGPDSVLDLPNPALSDYGMNDKARFWKNVVCLFITLGLTMWDVMCSAEMIHSEWMTWHEVKWMSVSGSSPANAAPFRYDIVVVVVVDEWWSSSLLLLLLLLHSSDWLTAIN